MSLPSRASLVVLCTVVLVELTDLSVQGGLQLNFTVFLPGKKLDNSPLPFTLTNLALHNLL